MQSTLAQQRARLDIVALFSSTRIFIPRSKYVIPKFERSLTRVIDVTSAESLSILSKKRHLNRAVKIPGDYKLWRHLGATNISAFGRKRELTRVRAGDSEWISIILNYWCHLSFASKKFIRDSWASFISCKSSSNKKFWQTADFTCLK